MAKHTDGPWIKDGRYLGKLDIVSTTSPDRLICRIGEFGSDVNDEDMANAALITAAPELLNTCKKTLTQILDGVVSNILIEELITLINKAENNVPN